MDAVAVGRERADGDRSCARSTLRVALGRRFRRGRLTEILVTPGIVRVGNATARRLLPFGLGRQTFALRGAELRRVEPGDVVDGMLLFACQGTRSTPVIRHRHLCRSGHRRVLRVGHFMRIDRECLERHAMHGPVVGPIAQLPADLVHQPETRPPHPVITSRDKRHATGHGRLSAQNGDKAEGRRQKEEQKTYFSVSLCLCGYVRLCGLQSKRVPISSLCIIAAPPRFTEST